MKPDGKACLCMAGYLTQFATKLKSQANSYWALTNLAGQLPAKGDAPRDQDGANGEPVMTESRPEGVTGKITRSSAAHRMAPGMLADLSEVGLNLARSLFDP